MFDRYKGIIKLEEYIKEVYGYDYQGRKELIEQSFILYEGTGYSAAFWVKDKENNSYLFKSSKEYPESTLYGELISNKLCNILGISCAEVRVCEFDGSYGILSKKLTNDDETIINGGELIQYVLDNYWKISGDKQYDGINSFLNDKSFLELYQIPKSILSLNDEQKIKYVYNNLNNLEQLWAIIDLYVKLNGYDAKDRICIIDNLVKMFIFDVITMQCDRHIENWGIIFDSIKKIILPCPFYDNAGILGLSHKNLDEYIDLFNTEYSIYVNRHKGNDKYGFINLFYKHKLLLTLNESDIKNPKQRTRKNNMEVLSNFLKVTSSLYTELFLDYINKVNSVDMLELLKEIELDNGIVIPDKIKTYINTVWNVNLDYIKKEMKLYGLEVEKYEK